MTKPAPDHDKDPTRSQFDAYTNAYDYFNERLFDGELPRCILNFARHARSNGYFIPDQWEREKKKVPEISLNPDVLKRPIGDTMGTLVHEMVHLWQHYFGKPSRPGYHNKEWGDRMESVGLMPSTTGLPGGRRTGQRVTHYIVPGGPFAVAFAAMPREYLLPWTSGRTAADPGKTKGTKDKVKYSCPGCGSNVWGKSGLEILCVPCGEPFAEAEAPAGRPAGAGRPEPEPGPAVIPMGPSLSPPPPPPPWLCITLGLAGWPCSKKDIRAAYRRQAKAIHPDAGGKSEAFIELERAYREALACCA